MVWSTGTSGNSGAYAVMQTDGNLVVYTNGGGPRLGGALWSSKTYGNPDAYATVQDGGNVVVYGKASTSALWASGTNARRPTITSNAVLKPGWWTQGTCTRLVMRADGHLVMCARRSTTSSAPWPPIDADPRPGDVAGGCTKCDRAAESLGWTPKLSPKDGIRSALDWIPVPTGC